MPEKCVHSGCGKLFSDPEEECHYHPGPPDFHEGAKGWKCCKPRVLNFDEFLTIPPCTTGKHSAVEDVQVSAAKPVAQIDLPITTKPATTSVPNGAGETPARLPQAPAQAKPQNPGTPAPPESDSDEPDAQVPSNASCKRRGCGVSSSTVKADRSEESCVYHPGQAIFHEGSKGWSCCKKRVLEFDEFMRIPGCKTRTKHCFVGKKKKKKENGDPEKVETVRHDFYQTGTTIHASLFLKKIDKDQSKIEFGEDNISIALDLRTQDGKRHETVMPLFGQIVPDKSSFKVLGTKLELVLAKADGAGWPVLRSDEKLTGEIIQTGRAGRA